ncbi:hypothetical protein [Yinghuangia soli]|uniref:DUF4232 domain-containing protein n=1 Tax=Yinghuangia soli TaxID=2908204 RepID=A0AA41U1A8_9ACTN|nr:hypothetical protein [Yinghuangia soli]MCF2529365.1 hypothetical protein [Yinghuangia soli]
MDSVTRPVGHLPPSVYWRRRAIVLVGLAVLIALVAWACAAGGGGDGKDDKKNAGADSPAPTAPTGTPGPIGPGDAAGGTSAGGGTGTPGGTAGTGGNAGATGANSGATGANAGATGANGTANGGANAGGTAGTTGGAVPPATGGGGNTTIAGMLACAYPGNAELVLIGDKPQDTKYRVGEQVKLTLEVRNTGKETCAVDLSQKTATVEIKSGADHIWSPADCVPADAKPEITQIQPGKSVTRSWTWTWTRSDPARCNGQAPALAAPPVGSSFAATAKITGIQWASKQYEWTVVQ